MRVSRALAKYDMEKAHVVDDVRANIHRDICRRLHESADLRQRDEVRGGSSLCLSRSLRRGVSLRVDVDQGARLRRCKGDFLRHSLVNYFGGDPNARSRNKLRRCHNICQGHRLYISHDLGDSLILSDGGWDGGCLFRVVRL